MDKRTPEHIAVWMENSRRALVDLNAELPDMSKEERLAAIRGQYEMIANIKKIFTLDAYFVGVPNRKHVL